jgi:hypothetical protein
MHLPYVVFFYFELTYIAPKQNFLPSMAFRPFLALDGVKSRANDHYNTGEKIKYIVLYVYGTFEVILHK